TDWGKGLQTIGSLRPEVVILDTEEGGIEPLAAAKEIMGCSPDTRVIALTLRDNKMHLYQTRETVASDVEDLLRAIREERTGRRR
ncbi:MAG: hypothetical protein GTN93_11235, partial [Anaerolineae bacterium]|nr:hypothetical protein [Anaerolineae bacterium]